MAEEASAPDFPVDERTDKGFANWFRSLGQVRCRRSAMLQHRMSLPASAQELLQLCGVCLRRIRPPFACLTGRWVLARLRSPSCLTPCLKSAPARGRWSLAARPLTACGAGVLHLPRRERAVHRQSLLQDHGGGQVHGRPGEGPAGCAGQGPASERRAGRRPLACAPTACAPQA